MLRIALAVFVGSGLGGVCRYLVSEGVRAAMSRGGWLHRVMPQAVAGLPAGTFLVNILGSFIIGLVYGLCGRHISMSPAARALLATGFCGGLTTFSTFSNENYELLATHQYLLLATYILLSVATCIAAAWAGHATASL